MHNAIYVPSGKVGHEINYLQFHDAVEQVKERVNASDGEIVHMMVRLIDVINTQGCTLGDVTDALYRLAAIRTTLKECLNDLPVAINMLN